MVRRGFCRNSGATAASATLGPQPLPERKQWKFDSLDELNVLAPPAGCCDDESPVPKTSFSQITSTELADDDSEYWEEESREKTEDEEDDADEAIDEVHGCGRGCRTLFGRLGLARLKPKMSITGIFSREVYQERSQNAPADEMKENSRLAVEIFLCCGEGMGEWW